MPRLPDHLYRRQYRTRDGRKRTLLYVQFTDWKGIRRTFPAGDRMPPALILRNKLLGLNTTRHDFDQDDTKRAPTFTAWMAHYLGLSRHKASHRQDVLRARYLTHHFGELPLTQLTTSRVEAYKQERAESASRYKKPPAPASINRELALLRTMLRLALKDDLLRKMPDIVFFAEHNERGRLVSPEEFMAVAEALPGEMSWAWQLAGAQGMRIGEVVGLTRARVDLAQQLLTIQRMENKERKEKVIPMSPAALAVLRAMWMRRPHGAPDEPVFWHQGKLLTYDALSRRFRHHVVPALGLKGLWIHDLRGTFITQKAAQLWDRKLIKAITGHRTDIAFDRYLRPSMDLLRQVVADEVPTQIRQELQDSG